MKMKKIKWYGVVLAIFVILMCLIGIYDFFMMLGHNELYYQKQGHGQAVVEYFTDYPIYFLIFWVANLLSGIISPILYLFKQKNCSLFALIAFVSDLMLILLTSIFRDRINVIGQSFFIADLVILGIFLAFYLFCRSQKAK